MDAFMPYNLFVLRVIPHRRELRSELAKERAGLFAGQIEASAEEKTRLWGFHTSYSGYLEENTPLNGESCQVRHLRLVTAASGAGIAEHVYYPFGEEITVADQNTLPLKFTGHERDFYKEGADDEGDDLDYMHARYCSPFAGRFLSVDPIGGAVGAPQSMNRYAYVGNNPMRFVDPTGEERYAILVGDPGLGDHNVGQNFERVAETRQSDLEAAGHTVDVTRVSTIDDVDAAVTSGGTIDGGVIIISHGGVLEDPGGDIPAVFIGEDIGVDTNLTASNVDDISNSNLGPNATIELCACNSDGVSQSFANSLGRQTTGTRGSMSFSPDPNSPMSSAPGTTPPATGPLYLVPDVNSQRITRIPR